MQQHISFGLLVSLSNHGFSLDELVLRLGEAFETNGFPGVLSLILNVVDEALCLALTGWQQEVVAECFKPCCEHCRWELKEREERTIRTSVGQLEMRWRRLRCVSCGKTLVPLRQWLGLEKWQSKTTELEKLVVEIVSEQSYRRSSDHLERIGQIPVPRSTAHRWVVDSGCDQITQPVEKLQTLLVDGTGFKRRPDATEAKNNQGEVRVAIGLTQQGRAVSLGSWSGKSWAEIGLDLERFEQRKDGTIAEFLVSDGEPGLAEGLAGLYNRITDPKDWQTWWEEKLGIANNVVCTIRDIKLLTPKAI